MLRRTQLSAVELILAALFISAFLLRVIGATLLPNIHHPDEVFQTLEPAHRLWTGWGVVTWEWRDGIRSWLLPGILYILMEASELLGVPWSTALPGISAVLAATSLSVVVVGYLVGLRLFGLAGGLLVGGACALWPDLVYFGPKTLTEVAAAHVMLVAAYLAFRESASPGRIRVIGLLLGAAFCLRFHLSIALLAIAVWACRGEWRTRWRPLILGVAIPVLALGVLDLVTWGTPFQSLWKNVWVNVIEGRSHFYGTSPAHWYFSETFDSWGLAVVPLVILFLQGARTAPLFALSALLIWLTHIPIAHKEMRFLYPATPFLLITAGLGSASFLHSLKNYYRNVTELQLAAAVLGCWAALSVLVVLRIDFRENWRRGSDVLAAQAFVRVQHDLCGLGLVGINWWMTGGYTYLHRGVPLYLHSQAAEGLLVESALRQFNYAITPARSPIGASFETKQCWGEICVQRREGGCAAPGAEEINSVLRDIGE